MTRQTRLGTNIKAARQAIPGMTQEALARAAVVSVRTVSRLESGETTQPHEDEFGRIAAALGKTPDDLRGYPLSAEPPEHRLPTISPEDERLMRVLRGPLHGARPFFLRFAELPAFDQRWVLDTLEYCEARIDAANDWERRRRSYGERDVPADDDAPARNGSLDHAGA